MSTTLTKTLKGKKFDEVFTEVPHSESLGLKNPEQLRLFRLDVRDNKFAPEGLQAFLLSNVGRYVFSRAKLEQFKLDDDSESIGLQAIRIMQENGSPDEKDTGNELGEIMLYAFLEQILEAPKLMSKVELVTDAKQYSSNADGVHLLSFGNTYGFPYYQLVFGTSSIIGDLKDAVDNAFDIIEKLESRNANEIQMVENTVFEKSFNKETTDMIKDILIPKKNKNSACDTAYGIFLGYTLGLDDTAYNTIQFRTELAKKMELDIQAHAHYISNQIKQKHLENHSFYFYILPLNDAESEKKNIMQQILNGGSSE